MKKFIEYLFKKTYISVLEIDNILFFILFIPIFLIISTFIFAIFISWITIFYNDLNFLTICFLSYLLFININFFITYFLEDNKKDFSNYSLNKRWIKKLKELNLFFKDFNIIPIDSIWINWEVRINDFKNIYITKYSFNKLDINSIKILIYHEIWHIKNWDIKYISFFIENLISIFFWRIIYYLSSRYKEFKADQYSIKNFKLKYYKIYWKKVLLLDYWFTKNEIISLSNNSKSKKIFNNYFWKLFQNLLSTHPSYISRMNFNWDINIKTILKLLI